MTPFEKATIEAIKRSSTITRHTQADMCSCGQFFKNITISAPAKICILFFTHKNAFWFLPRSSYSDIPKRIMVVFQ